VAEVSPVIQLRPTVRDALVELRDQLSRRNRNRRKYRRRARRKKEEVIETAAQQ
jgi:hypothetical protein